MGSGWLKVSEWGGMDKRERGELVFGLQGAKERDRGEGFYEVIGILYGGV